MDEQVECFCMDPKFCAREPVFLVNKQVRLCWYCFIAWARASMRLADCQHIESLVKTPVMARELQAMSHVYDGHATDG